MARHADAQLGAEQVAKAEEVITELYGFKEDGMEVLFKPTKASEVPIRHDYDQAVSYVQRRFAIADRLARRRQIDAGAAPRRRDREDRSLDARDRRVGEDVGDGRRVGRRAPAPS